MEPNTSSSVPSKQPVVPSLSEDVTGVMGVTLLLEDALHALQREQREEQSFLHQANELCQRLLGSTQATELDGGKSGVEDLEKGDLEEKREPEIDPLAKEATQKPQARPDVMETPKRPERNRAFQEEVELQLRRVVEASKSFDSSTKTNSSEKSSSPFLFFQRLQQNRFVRRSLAMVAAFLLALLTLWALSSNQQSPTPSDKATPPTQTTVPATR